MEENGMAVTNFFLGANSGDGFQNLFYQLAEDSTLRDLIILKGGPGVGKSTFMKQIGRAMEDAGTAVEYLWCSGDPDSLDGVYLPELHCGVADGTAPHVLEPAYPAAVQRYVDLGRFYDLTAAKENREEIIRLTEENHRAYARAYHSLKAARQVELEAETETGRTFDCRRAQRRLRGILAREFRGRGEESGKVQKRFLGSVTHRGYIWRFDSVEALCPKVYEFSDSCGLAAESFRQIAGTAAERGWDVITCPCPEEPGRLEHLLIPGLGLAFVTSRPGMEYPGKICRRIRMDAMAHPEDRARLRFAARMAGLLRRDGVAALQEAKDFHDALEAVYNPYVDFDGVRAQAALEISRLQSWMIAG
jgi:hypothetical protein